MTLTIAIPTDDATRADRLTLLDLAARDAANDAAYQCDSSPRRVLTAAEHDFYKCAYTIAWRAFSAAIETKRGAICPRGGGVSNPQ